MTRPKRIERINDYSLMGPEYQRRVQEVDPDLVITYHPISGWSVWREEADATGEVYHRPIARQRTPGAKFDINQLVNELRARDTSQRGGKSHEQFFEDYLKDLEREEKEKDDRMYEALRPVHERFAWTVAKETGNLSKFVGFTPAAKTK